MRFVLWVGTGLLLSVLGGCGGGGGGGTGSSEVSAIPQNSGNTSGNTSGNNAGTPTSGNAAGSTAGGAGNTASGTAGGASGSASGTDTPASNPALPPVTVTAVSAPPDGATLSGNVFLRIEGNNIQNAELLPANGYTPRLGVFVVAPDFKSASLALNTTTIPNGPLSLRISAYNAPAGTSGASEVVAMPARTWNFANDSSPFGSQEGRAARCQQMGFSYTDPSLDLPVVCITATPTSTPPAQCSNLGTGYGNPEDLLPVLRNGTPVAKLYCEPGANGGVVNTGCVCLS